MLFQNVSKLVRYADFSPYLAYEHTLLAASESLHIPALADRVYGRIQRLVYSWVQREFRSLLTNWMEEEESAIPFDHPSKAPIWVCWLQGESQMPTMLRRLVCNMKRLQGDHQLRLIDYRGVKALDLLPVEVIDQYEAGSISPAFLSDIIRVALLERYGGLWMDATVLQTSPIPEEVFKVPFWSVKNLNGSFPYSRRVPYALQWQSYFLASAPHALFVRAMKSFLLEYVHRYSTLIDYYLIFYFAHFLLSEVPILRKEYENLQANNQLCELLDPFLMRERSMSHLDVSTFQNTETIIYKLSRHHQYPPGTVSTIRQLIQTNTDHCR
ncbi:capsular polysaccharide synthesis protein [Bifidobacterium asteroides]|uniref:capsular polysaccharide synthesis protein n=1 Tax=Bifidobacterium asteroides TaxID=1684 RepID=UPI0018DDBE90|nr:capsular polysaccharide synthesis protein [Bifidobacterium asteroides]MBH9983914.1 hypothetical protein [Bifidobacterium asteroides]